MSNDDLFYICGSRLAVSAPCSPASSACASKSFPGEAAPLVALCFVGLIGATTTFAVLHAQDEEEAQRRGARRRRTTRSKHTRKSRSAKPKRRRRGAGRGSGEAPKAAANGPGGTLQLAASPTELAFDTTELTSKPGKVTIDFDNPAALEHDVAIEQDGKEIADSELITEGKTSVSADLAPGTYTFLCTVPGHAEAGMEGTLDASNSGAASAALTSLDRQYPEAMGKRYHVTTFGCQMNVHDSERMQGMLESLGYEEAASRDERRPDPLQHLLDPRVGRQPLHRPPGRGEAAQVRRPRAGRRRRRLLGAVGQGRGLPALPLRRRRLRPGPDPQAGRVPQLRLAQRPGLLRVRGLLRPPADPARARVPGLAADLPGLQLQLLLLHRPLDPGPRGQPRPGRAGRRGRGARRRRRARGDPARPERQQLRPRPAAASRGSASPSCSARVDAIDGIERIRYTSPHPKDMKEDVIRAHAELPALCEHIHLPLQSGSSAVLKRMRRTYDRQRYMDRVSLIREHVPDCAITTDIIVGFPGETRGRLRADARGGRRGRLRRRLHLRLLAAARNRGGDARRAGPAPGQGRADGAAGRAGAAARRRTGPAVRRPRDGGAGRRDQPHRRDAPARPHPAQQGGQLRRHRRARGVRRGRDRRGNLADAERGAAKPLTQLFREACR